MKKIIAAFAAASLLAGSAVASEELAKAKNCLTCHAADKKIVGPSYKDIVAKRSAEKASKRPWRSRSRPVAKGSGVMCRCRRIM
jgi:cytochrome c